MAHRYVLDTSALIDLDSFYPEPRFPGVWKSFTGLVKDGRAVAPKQVSAEIVKSAFLREWCKINKLMFIALKEDALRQARKIANKHKNLISQNRLRPQADPFIIALAIDLQRSLTKDEPVIITQENPTKRDKIPYVARSYGIESDRLMGLFARERWTF